MINEQLDDVAREGAIAKGGKQSLADSEAGDGNEIFEMHRRGLEWKGAASFSETRSLRRLTCKLTNDDIVWL